MDVIAPTRTRQPTLQRPRLSMSSTNTFNPGGDFRCEEPTHNCDDVLLSGSDDEYYNNPDERLRKLEEQARLYLQGRRPLLLSASLRGPFDWESGWENPWLGRRSRIPQKGTSCYAKTRRAPEATTSEARITSRTRTASRKRSPVSDLTTQSRLGDYLGTVAEKPYHEKDPEVKKRMAGTSWLRCSNLKRTRTNDDGAATSPTPVRTISLADHPIATYDLEISISSRSVSAPPIARTASLSEADAAVDTTLADDIIAESSIISQPNNNAAGYEQSGLCVSDSKEVTSHLCELDCANSLGFVSSNDAAVSIQSEAAGPTGDDLVTATVLDSDTVLPSKEIDATNANDSAPVHDARSSACINLRDQDDNMQQVSVSSITSSIAPATLALGSLEKPATVPSSIDTDANEIRALLAPPGDGGSENSRLATQFQSPWTKSQTSAFPDLVVSDNVGRVSSPSMTPLGSKQSPWIRKKQPHSPDIELASKAAQKATEKLSPSASNMANVFSSQNPWTDANFTATSYSIAQLPTSPCSPGKDGLTNSSAEKHDLDRNQHHESLLPSLPIPIHAASSSVTEPSTPETKQSSLPTPDMTVSIKSFRRFRPATPTPPPRRGDGKSVGPQSILRQPHQRSRPGKMASRLGRRVHFDIPQQEEIADGHRQSGLGATDQQRTASSPPLKQALFECLPIEVDRFKCHFAAMAERTDAQRMPSISCSSSTRLAATSNNSARYYSSPRVDASATRFQDAEKGMAELRQASPALSQESPKGSGDTGIKSLGAYGEADKENATHALINKQLHVDNCDIEPVPSAVDDEVQDVMDNLDDFLGLWDMDAELAQVRSMT